MTTAQPGQPIQKTSILAAARNYLNEFFTNIDEECKLLYQFWCSAIQSIPPGGVALEVGTGPAIYTAIPLAAHFKEIHLADYVVASLLEIKKWLDCCPEAFNWQPFIELVLEIEGKLPNTEEMNLQSRQLRQAITKLMGCDMLAVNPLGETHITYHLVTAHYSTEVAATTLEEWLIVVKNISKLIKPKGYLMMSIASDLEQKDWVYGTHPPKPSPIISPDDVITCLQYLYMNMETLRIESIPAPDNRPYTNTILVFAQKK